MKKITAILLIFILCLSTVSVLAEEYVWGLGIFVNGKKLSFPDAQPFVDANNRTQVPVRFVSEALSATVEWMQETQSVVVTKDDKRIELFIGKNEMFIDGEVKVQDSAPVLMENRTFVPLRFVSEALDATVEWEQETNSVFIELDENQIKTITGESVDINGFTVELNDDDKATAVKNNIHIVKTSGLVIDGWTGDGSIRISFLLNRNSGDEESALKDIQKVLCKNLSEEKIDEALSFTKKAFNQKDMMIEYKDIVENELRISIDITSHSFSLAVIDLELLAIEESKEMYE